MIEGVKTQKQKLFEIKAKKNYIRFPARFTISRFKIVNVYRYGQLQGQILRFQRMSHYLDCSCHFIVFYGGHRQRHQSGNPKP